MAEDDRKGVARESEPALPTLPRPKTLKRLPVAPAEPLVVPARMVNEVLYCERLVYLEWVQGEFKHNFFTVEGKSVHERVDRAGSTRRKAKKTAPEAAAEPETADATNDDVAAAEIDERVVKADAEVAEVPAEEARDIQTRSLWLTSDRLGITTKIDVVEEQADGSVSVVEYKRGKSKGLEWGAYLPERAQLCAQVLVLRDHGYVVNDAFIYYAGDRKRVPIEINDWLINTTLDAVKWVREVVARDTIPSPLKDNPKCNGCSLSGVCLPDEVNLLKALDGEPIDTVIDPYEHEHLKGPISPDPWDIVGPQEKPTTTLRQLVPSRDDRVPVYVRDQGGVIGLSGEQLTISTPSGRQSARLPNTSEVNVFGNIQITTQALRALVERGIPVSLFSYGGWFSGRVLGHDSKNVQLRMAQHAAAQDDSLCVRIARTIITSKILNCRTLLRRNVPAIDPAVLFELKQLARKASECVSLESLLGIEGTAARVYFGSFTKMLKGVGDFDLEGRNRRPPKDPLNAMLSFAYALLTKDFTHALTTAGLDPLLGFYHQPRFGRPALALDLMEEFRPLIADSTVIGAINNDVVRDTDFVIARGGCALSDAARRRFILAYERRMDQQVTHPLFGYRISYRRVLEVQARLLGRLLLGEIAEYPQFRTR